MKTTPVGIGIVGAGFARTTQIPGFRDCMGAKVIAIASRHRDRAAEVAREFAIEHVAADWQELVERNDVDLISIVGYYTMLAMVMDSPPSVRRRSIAVRPGCCSIPA